MAAMMRVCGGFACDVTGSSSARAASMSSGSNATIGRSAPSLRLIWLNAREASEGYAGGPSLLPEKVA